MKIPYGRQNIEQYEIDEVVKTLNQIFLHRVLRLMNLKMLCKLCWLKITVAVSNATAGLHIAVKSLGLKKGDRIITTPIFTRYCARSMGLRCGRRFSQPTISFEKCQRIIKNGKKEYQ